MNRPPPTITMLPDGTFASPRVPRVPISAKLMVGAFVAAALGISILVAALAIWVVSMVLPMVIIAGATGWAVFKYRRWQSLRSQGNVPPRDVSGFRQ